MRISSRPTSLYSIDLEKLPLSRPSRSILSTHEGKFHLAPLCTISTYTLNPKTFQVIWAEDTSKMYPIKFFVQGSEYKLLGLIPTNLHLFGVEEGGTILYPGHG